MSVRDLVSLITLPTENEQSGTTPKTVAASFTSREYPELANFNRAKFFLNVSAISGSGASLTITIEEEDPFATGIWNTVVTFSAITTVSSGTPQAVELYGLNYRLQAVVAGTTPSITFTCGAVTNSEEPLT